MSNNTVGLLAFLILCIFLLILNDVTVRIEFIPEEPVHEIAPSCGDTND